ncbi:EF-P 5-aminopentanol modification-associated protein YfmH [Peribacillus sp. NPDC096622]|uniref:EF-P 5-aminopentanol modification-associated protein YfmH n=1 Tax=Peribacillus sp. NPDC096622 TaxID=3364396 RepID=UPI003814CA2C
MFTGSFIEEKKINGLDTLLVNKKGFLENYILLSIDFGGVDSNSIYHEKECNSKIPYGTAHFLEHLIFQNNQFDVLHRFGNIGSSINASTNFEYTSFVISCTEQLELNIQMILKLVQSISITNDIVEKEKKIIKQEILQTQSNKKAKCFTNLLSDLYGDESGVAQPIVGNLASIDSMDSDILEKCFQKFYSIENMKIIIIGDIIPEEIYTIIGDELASSTSKDKNRYLPLLPVKRESINIEPINTNQSVLLFGNTIANESVASDTGIRKEFIIRIGLEILFGRTSDFQQKISNHSLVDRDIDLKYEISNSYSFSLLSAITTKPCELMEEIRLTKNNIQTRSIDDYEFLISKRRIIGMIIDVYDNPTKLANSILHYSIRGINFCDVINVINKITKKEVIDGLYSHILI